MVNNVIKGSDEMGLGYLDLTRLVICNDIYSNLLLNANTLKCRECYIKCANKYKLPVLLKAENQVVMGRRGTGKTTIFKAFTFYVNNIYGNEHLRAWYVSIDECMPNKIELLSDSVDDIVLICLKNFLRKLMDLFYHDFHNMERGRLCKSKVAVLEKEILELGELIDAGSPQYEQKKTSVNETFEISEGYKADLGISRRELSADLAVGAEKQLHVEKKNIKEFIYKLNISDIRRLILNIFENMGYEKVYFCIDEFNLIDRQTTISIQSKFAQVLKQLFFGNNIIVVKIANVWNESRMQTRQFSGEREGIEMDQDIFQRHELNLDTMFEYSNDTAISFFKDMLVNDLIYQQGKENISDDERKYAQDEIIEKLFNKNSFEHLVCGSMGIPRVFGTILSDCLGKLRRDNFSDKISVSIMCDAIIDHYNKKVRQGIPYSSVICKCIDNYVTENKRRFFLVKIREYNKGVYFFDGLVAKNALHQCPSEQVPRKIRNEYKIYFVHYGNYLESLKENVMKTFYAEIDNVQLYPEFPSDIIDNIDSYVLDVPDNAFDEIYCSKCLRYYKKEVCIRENYTLFCPYCKEPIVFEYE